MILLKTARLILRPHQAADEPAFVRMHTDPLVRRYVGGRAWDSDEALRRFRTRYVGKPHRTYGLWATILEAEDAYVGMCGLTGNASDPRLAFYIARDYWNRRFATEAARALVGYGFDTLKLAAIRADAERGNVASERILTNLGFRIAREETLSFGRVIVHYEITAAAAPPSTS